MMFAFMVLWAYLSFSQFLIIWAGNLPDEIPWYVRRLRGGWGWVALTLVIFHFATPFVLLLMRGIKRNAQRLFEVCVLMLAVRMLDVYWIVEPSFYNQQLQIHWMDFVTPLAVGGLWLALFFWQVKSRPLLPLRDPRLAGRAAGDGGVLNMEVNPSIETIEAGHESQDAKVRPIVLTLARSGGQRGDCRV